MAANRLVGAAAKQHEGAGGKGGGIGGIVAALERKAQAKQGGHDRLHQPFGQAAAFEPGGQGEQVHRWPRGGTSRHLLQHRHQGRWFQPHIRINEQQPLRPGIAGGPLQGRRLAGGPVLATPALPLGPGPHGQQTAGRPPAALIGLKTPLDQPHRGIAGAVIGHH